MGAAYTAGDVLPFAIQTTDATGSLANTASASLSVLLPDGTTGGPFTPTNPSTGVYRYDYTSSASLYGRYLGLWTTSGTVAGGEPQAFWVLPAACPVTVTEARRHLGITSSADDDEIAAFILAAIGVVESIAGPIVPTTKTYKADGGGFYVSLMDRPTAITTVVEDGVTLSASQYEVDLPTGIIYKDSGFKPGFRKVAVTYTTGSTVQPAVVQGAIKDLLRIMWRQVKGGPNTFQDEQFPAVATAAVSDAMMNRLRNLLGNTREWLI